MDTPYFLITGASKGLGKALAINCAKRKTNLLLVALPDENLENFSTFLENNYLIKVAFFEIDLTNPQGVYKITKWIDINKFRVNGLINNAGVGEGCNFEECSPKSVDLMIQLNIRASTMLIHLLLPELKKHPISYVLNVSSLAGWFPLANKSIYPATKIYMNYLTKILKQELRAYNIYLSILAPGPMATNKQVCKRIEQNGFFSQKALLSVNIVAEKALNGLYNKQAIIIPGIINQCYLLLLKLLPERLIIKITSRLIGTKKYYLTTNNSTKNLVINTVF